jgi:hypothetical protein
MDSADAKCDADKSAAAAIKGVFSMVIDLTLSAMQDISTSLYHNNGRPFCFFVQKFSAFSS